MKLINNENHYKPKEISDLGLLISHKNKRPLEYYQILRLIKSGKITAIDYSKTDRPYFVVAASEIKRHNKLIKY